ncbi:MULTISPECIES: hypothetical protein [unclassified Shigella]|uniref:hypothetical protein n=1 Tax=unclassified Shigella TaxID=2629414 RepID=UPI000847E002|nr:MULTISPECIES: hypothetical protein [unclassified Shigella]ODQ05210.1 hypothetical protein BGK50_04300 [Shigella sp. FC130]OEI92661.1 hypothetical protein BHE86_05790 [Shigella sp. FC1655]OEJ08521.1 hypothetical protein BHE89_12165 [Shigella sp. FC1967]
MDKSRQQFEYWYFNNHSHEQKYPLHKDESGEYYYDGTRKAWISWQASRESLEVELPDPFIANENCETWCYDEDLVNQALISNGVKIKNES